MNKLVLFVIILLVMLFLGTDSIAEDITLSTYHPAPGGVYEELVTKDSAYLATTNGNVGIGTELPVGKLHVQNVGDDGTPLALVLDNNSINQENFIYLMANGDLKWIIGMEDADEPLTDTNDFVIYNDDVGINGSLSISYATGNVGIGTYKPSSKLFVAGDIKTSGELRKNGTAYNNPDYVFEQNYKLMDIMELKDFVLENKHLPNMPSAQEVREQGVNLFEQNRLLLEKLEEAYLYIFELEKRVSELEKRFKKIKRGR